MIDLQYCNDTVFEGNINTKYRHWFLIPAIIITLTLALLEKRRGVKPHLFRGRLAFISPFSFIDEPANRYGILLSFGSVTGNIITVIQKTFTEEEFPIWAKIFLVYVLCLEVSVICYPLFVCMTTRHKLLGSITGLLYSIGWFIFEMFMNVQILRCYSDYNEILMRNVNLTAHMMIQGLPVTLCNFFLIPKFGFKLYKCWRTGIYKSKKENGKLFSKAFNWITKQLLNTPLFIHTLQPAISIAVLLVDGGDMWMVGFLRRVVLCKSYHLTYVRHLLKKHLLDTSLKKGMTLKQKIQNKVMHPIPGFRFPVAIMISTFMSSIMLYMVSLLCAEFMEAVVKLPLLKEYLDLTQSSIVIAILVTVVCGIRNIYVFLTNYRRDMLLLYKGDRSFIPSIVRTRSPNVYMAQGMRFIGTSITGMLWGTVFVYLLVFIPLASTMVVIRFLTTIDKLDDLWEQFQWLIYPVSMIIIFKLQIFLIGRFFIQPKLNPADKYRPLAVDNRNVYDVLSFFMIFLNASIGVISFLKRIMIGACLGVFLIPRMDRSLLMRGYETMDKCYVNYIGMIMVDEAHNHPVMRVFAWLVKENAENRRDRAPLNSAVDNPEYGNIDFSPEIPVESGTSQAKRRWWLAYTLVRNPSLTALRVRNFRNINSNSTAELKDIECSTESVDTKDVADTWKLSFRCCNNYKCTIPPNIIINGMAMIVVLCVLLLYTGFPLVVSNISWQLGP